MTIPACMGGFCSLRDKCLHYTQPTNRQEPAERKCEQGAERVMFFAPMVREAA